MCLLAIACTCSAQSPPATTSVQPKSKRIWTNDDMPSLSGGINVLGEKDTPKEDAAVPAAKKEREQEKCESDAWVAAVTAILNSQGVPYGKRYWAERLFGYMCVENVTVNAVASRIDGDYALDDGQRPPSRPRQRQDLEDENDSRAGA